MKTVAAKAIEQDFADDEGLIDYQGWFDLAHGRFLRILMMRAIISRAM